MKRRTLAASVSEHEDTLPLAVDLVCDPVAAVAERALLRHRVGQVYSTPIEAETAPPSVRSHGREARRALRTARVPGARLSA